MDDSTLAALMAETPPAADPGFRVDVFMRIAQRAQRRVALRRAVLNAAAFAALGLAAAALGVFAEQLSPLTTMLGLAGGVAVVALVLIEGPRAVGVRARSAFRLSL